MFTEKQMGITTAEQIKEKAKQLLFRVGLRSVSMDDIARQAGVSKKTIYQYFDNKNAVVDAVIDDLVNAHEYVFRTTLANSKDAIALWIKTATEFGDTIPEPKGRRLIFA